MTGLEGLASCAQPTCFIPSPDPARGLPRDPGPLQTVLLAPCLSPAPKAQRQPNSDPSRWGLNRVPPKFLGEVLTPRISEQDLIWE